jgi:hypothetical protein
MHPTRATTDHVRQGPRNPIHHLHTTPPPDPERRWTKSWSSFSNLEGQALGESTVGQWPRAIYLFGSVLA